MDDQHAQFLIAVGDLCAAAGLAGLEVQVQPREDGGPAVRGVPSEPSSSPAARDQVDDIGYRRTLAVGDRIIDLESIVACTIYAPANEAGG
ncbi:MAG TPA: hypothetical protein VKV21_12760 [Solirubrobacteraceae bacterium]|nr:hypothetical protein [Solirubrobacteraceae bacterium]